MDSLPGSNPEDRDEAKRVQFYHAAEPLFERYGFRKTTVEEICESAKASKRTFYELFHDKSDLFVHLLAHIADDMVNDYREQIQNVDLAIDRLNIYFEVYMAAALSRPVFRMVLEDPKLILQLTDHMHEGQFQMESTITHFTDLLEYGMKTGEFRKMNPGIVTWIIHAMMDGLYLVANEVHPKQGYVESPEFINEVRNFILKGLGIDSSEERFKAE